MIEINLVPDVKQELIRAQRIRASVVSLAVVIGIAAIAVVVLLALYVFGAQTLRGVLSDKAIKSESQKLIAVPDLGDTLTIQNQLTKLSSLHAGKHIDSRIFDVLTTIVPPIPNDVSVTNLALDSDNRLVTIEAQASGGYSALEVFKKTINATNLEFTMNGERQTVPLASEMSDSDRSYGEDSSGKRILRFTISFVYPDELFSPAAENATIVAPTRRNATDSYLGVPKSLFSKRSSDIQEEQ